MTTAKLSTFLRRLTRGMAAETLGEQSDRQLVARLLAKPEDSAFEAVVRRHGPMVYRVCWRILQHSQDAEDAFQATFLVLAQKLRTVRKHASLASWLHGVARRVALKAKAQAATRHRHEQQVPPPSTSRRERAGREAADEVTWGELRSVLDTELAKLPDKWRQPLVLCYLEGRTQDEAGGQLGWSKNTFRRRLDEARTVLGRRLTRRGVIWPAALFSVLLSDCVASAALPPGLIVPTVETATCIAAGKAAPAIVSAKVAALTKGTVKTMVLTKLKIATAVVLTLSAIAGSFVFQTTPSDPPERNSMAAAKEQANKADAFKQDPMPLEVKELQGQWRVVERERNGKKLPAYEARSARISFVFQGEVMKSAWWTGKEGSHPFKLDPAQNPKTIDITLDDPWKYRIVGIYRLEGGRLRICFCFLTRGLKRPTEFETQEDDARDLLLLERVQPKGTAQKPPDAAADEFGGILYEWRQPERAVQEKFFKVFNSAKTPDERKKVEEQRKADEAKMKAEVAAKLEPLADRCLKLAETYPDTPAGLAALCWAVSNAPATKAGKDALAILKQGRIDRADLDELADAVGLGAADWHINHAMTPEIKQALAMLTLERVKQKLDQPRAAQLLDWVCTSFMDEESPAPHRAFVEAADLIVSRFADSPDINHLAEVLGVIRNPPWAPQYEKHLRAILKANQHSHVLLEARFALAAILQGKGAEHEARKEYEQFVKERDDRARLYAQGRKDFQPDPWEGIFNDLAKQAKNELAGMLVRGLGESPEIDGEDLDGRPMKLSDFRGKVVLVSFWATWCGPCMKFVPHERAVLERLGDKPFVIVGVNGDKAEELAKALEKNPVTWRSFKNRLAGKTPITDEWKILAWPTLYLLDHQGVIRKRWIGAPPKEDLDREVDKLVQAAQK